MASKTATRTFSGAYERVFGAMTEAARLEGLTIREVDQGTGVIRMSSGMSLASWGESFQVQIRVPQPGEVAVPITSSQKFGLVERGKNKKNIDRLFARLETLLS